jgi:hypothetical protein
MSDNFTLLYFTYECLCSGNVFWTFSRVKYLWTLGTSMIRAPYISLRSRINATAQQGSAQICSSVAHVDSSEEIYLEEMPYFLQAKHRVLFREDRTHSSYKFVLSSINVKSQPKHIRFCVLYISDGYMKHVQYIPKGVKFAEEQKWGQTRYYNDIFHKPSFPPLLWRHTLPWRSGEMEWSFKVRTLRLLSSSSFKRHCNCQ